MVVQLTTAPDQTRARYPDEEGYVERGGVRLFYEVYGEGRPTVLMLPTWSIVHSRIWKMQIPYLARHFRVLTFDGRGNGKSDRPASPEAYGQLEFAADALAVMDGARTERAVLVSCSRGALWATLLAAEHPDRVAGAVFIGPVEVLARGDPERQVHFFAEQSDTREGWEKYNRRYWLEHYEEFLEDFFDRCFSEPHSTKQIEDCVGWGLETTPETLVATEEAMLASGLAGFPDLCARVRCPVLVLHGGDDAIRPLARGAALAEATGGTLVVLEGSGHSPHARDPVKVNLLIREFVELLERSAR